MTTFARAWPSARTHLDRIFGEAVQIVPMVVNQRLGSLPDPSRAAMAIRAKFTLKHGAEGFQGARKGSEMEGFGMREVAEATLSIRAAERARLPYALLKGDHVVLSDQPGQPRYSIVKDAPTHRGDVTLALIIEKQP